MMSSQYILLAGSPSVRVGFWNYRTDDGTGECEVGIKWIGTPDALIAAGVVTAEMLAPAQKRGRRDEEGERYSIKRWFGSDNGQPYRRYCVLRWKRRDRMLRLPGAQAALAVGEAREQEAREFHETHARFEIDESRTLH